MTFIELCRQLGYALRFILGKPIFDGDVFSFDPTKLAQLLPERPQETRRTGTSAWIEITDAEDFPRLLREGGKAKHKEQSAQGKS